MNFKQIKNIVIGITGASGIIYAKLLIEYFQFLNVNNNFNISVVFSKTGKDVTQHEIGNDFIKNIPYKIYNNNDFNAPFASGSSVTDTMIIIPCSMGTLGRIAHGTSESLICRTADVILKEKKKLILVTRETPLNLIHIKNMEILTLAGGIILPASPSFYLNPQNITEACHTIIYKIIDLLNVKQDIPRWGK